MTPAKQPGDSSVQSRIEHIETETGIVFALGKPAPEPNPADTPEARHAKQEFAQRQRKERERFLKRYQLAIRAYLGALLSNREAVDEVFDRLVDQWLDGKLSGFDPTRPFRPFLKGVLHRNAGTYRYGLLRRSEREPVALDSGYVLDDPLAETASTAFDHGLRDSLIEDALEDLRKTNEDFYEVLQLYKTAEQIGQPAPTAREVADVLSRDRDLITEDNARQITKRARMAYSESLIRQVQSLIGDRNLQRTREELEDLGLLQFCIKALDKMRGDAS